MAGIPTESPLVLRESLGPSHNRLTSAEDYEEALLSGYPPVGLLDAKNVYDAEQKGNRLPRPERGACAHHGVRNAPGPQQDARTQDAAANQRGAFSRHGAV